MTFKKLLLTTTTLFLFLLYSQLIAQNVGIGTTNPTSKMHVVGDIKVENLHAYYRANSTQANGNSGLQFQNLGTGKGWVVWDNINEAIKLLPSFFPSGNTFTVQKDGGVGIGTVSDSARLHIRSGSTSNGHALDVDNSLNENLFTIRDNGNVGINYPQPNARLTMDGGMNLYSDGTFYGQMFEGNNDLFINGKFGFFSIFPNPPIPSQDIIMQAGAGPFVFGFPGNVGIGTNAPEAKLHVSSTVMIGSGTPAAGYALSVNGKVMAEEVRVQLDADWPDYVFGDDYHLMSLKEIETFINSNKHLPGIPKAEKIESEGLDTGEMNRLLMEKVEELTLHVITLSKEIEILKANK